MNSDIKDMAFDMVDALSAPLLTFSASWADTIPKRMKDIIPQARMIALMKREQLATYLEIVIYLQTRSLEAPMDYEWTDIYTHVSCTVLLEWFKEDHFENVRAPKKLSNWLQSQLDDLRRKLYNKRRELLKTKLHKEKKKAA